MEDERTIVVADETAEHYSVMLENLGYKVVRLDDENRALAYCLEHRPRIVVASGCPHHGLIPRLRASEEHIAPAERACADIWYRRPLVAAKMEDMVEQIEGQMRKTSMQEAAG